MNLSTVIKPEDKIIQIIDDNVLRIREDCTTNPYILELQRVLPVEGYRSAIGAMWNAVADDLRNKIMYRSLDLFNKEAKIGRDVTSYEDFQDYVTDEKLIEGAYKIGVINWEAKKMLQQARTTRNIFAGHPMSSDPSPAKVLSFIEDCIKYVLSAEYPQKIININEYIENMEKETFDRNQISIENALGDLPQKYIVELVNRLLTIYIFPDSSSILISNIEFLAPLLWNILQKETKVQIVRRVDEEIIKGDEEVTQKAFSFVRIVKGEIYLSRTARNYKISPLVIKLKENLDDWAVESECVKELSGYAEYITDQYNDDYVWALTQTYVGRVGSSSYSPRTDFFSNGAAPYIPAMFQTFDDAKCASFVHCLKSNETLIHRIHTPSKLRRLRTLGNIIGDKMSESFQDRKIIEFLLDKEKEELFFNSIKGV